MMELGIVTEVRPVHPAKAASPMYLTLYVVPLLVTVDGIVSAPVGWV